MSRMKVLILSDSHGLEEEIKQIVNRHQHEVEAIFHCGDSELPSTHPALKDVLTVKGNCDRSDFPEEIRKEIGGRTIYVTHGHLYNVKMSYVRLTYRAEEVGAKLVFFGHSHLATTFERNNVIYINPGSIRLPRNSDKKTYCICEWNEETTTVTYYELNGEIVNTETF